MRLTGMCGFMCTHSKIRIRPTEREIFVERQRNCSVGSKSPGKVWQKRANEIDYTSFNISKFKVQNIFIFANVEMNV